MKSIKQYIDEGKYADDNKWYYSCKNDKTFDKVAKLLLKAQDILDSASKSADDDYHRIWTRLSSTMQEIRNTETAKNKV